MINPFTDIRWNPGRAERRNFARSLVIGFPGIAAIFAIAGWVKTHAFPEWTFWLAAMGAGAGVILWLIPQIARPFYLAWFFLACCIGIVVSNALLAAFYYLVITPMGLVMRACGRDPMKRRFDRAASTYWRAADKTVDPRRYFRQF